MAKIDFSRARMMHRNWRSQLRQFLNGAKTTLTEIEVLSHEDCQLGKWLYNEGLIVYEALPEIRRLESLHVRLHNHARVYMDLKKAGNTVLLDREWKRIETLSEEILALLTEIEKKEK